MSMFTNIDWKYVSTRHSAFENILNYNHTVNEFLVIVCNAAMNIDVRISLSQKFTVN